ncbi:MAG: CHAT domain-containing tetratricopeptide repeat protein [Mycobacterium sp.]
MLAHWTPNPHLDALRAALERGERTALNTLELIVDEVRGIVPTLVENFHEWVSGGADQHATSQGPDIAALVLLAGDVWGAVQIYVLVARTFWRSSDPEQTVAMYQLAIGLSDHLPPEHTTGLAAWHDNMALALAALGRLDEAIAHYRIAARLETQPAGQLHIRNNLAMAYSDLGEYALAAREQEAICKELEDLGSDPATLAIAYDNWALSLGDLGNLAKSAELLERAAVMFPRNALADRRANASNRTYSYNSLGQPEAAAAAFRESWNLTVELAQRIDEEHFRTGYFAALPHLSPPNSPVWGHFHSASELLSKHDWAGAAAAYAQAAEAAQGTGDVMTFLRCRVNLAAVLADAQRVDEALQECARVQQAAAHIGLAGPLAMALIATASLFRGGSDRGGPAQALMISAQALAFAELRDRLAEQADLPADHIERLAVVDVGVPLAQVAAAANSCHESTLAERYYRQAIATAQRFGYRAGELNRQVGLLQVLGDDPAREAEAHAIEVGLREALTRGDTPLITKFVIHRYLGARATDPDQSLLDLRSAAALLDALRAQVAPGEARSDLDREYEVYPTLLHFQQKYDAPAVDAFASLQASRARRLMELLTAASGDRSPYRPVGLEEIIELLAVQPRLTTFVDVTVTADGLRAYLVDFRGLRTVDVAGDTAAVHRAQYGDADRRARDVIELVVGSRLLADLAAAVTATLAEGSTILIAVDDPLSNLPLHAIPLGTDLWADVVSIGRIAAAGALRFTPAQRGWSGRSIVAGDSNSDLPGAARECATVAGLIGARPIVGPACTFDAVRGALTAEPDDRIDVVHLAVHGRADVRRGGRGSLLFAGDPPSWAPFADLANLPWRAELIVFSGCSTAVGGPRNGLGLYGVAQAAAEAGATTVLASLWPVDDVATAVFMTAFYQELARRRGSGLIDLRELMDHARRHLRQSLDDDSTSHVRRNGRELILEGEDVDLAGPVDARVAAMLKWAPFVLIGEPSLVI